MLAVSSQDVWDIPTKPARSRTRRTTARARRIRDLEADNLAGAVHIDRDIPLPGDSRAANRFRRRSQRGKTLGPVLRSQNIRFNAGYRRVRILKHTCKLLSPKCMCQIDSISKF